MAERNQNASGVLHIVEDRIDEDALLVQRFARGDCSAFDRLVERWRTPLVRFLHRFLGDRERAEDIAQEVLVNLFRTADRYQARRGVRFSSYLFRMATNAGLNERKRLARRLATEPLERGEQDEPHQTPDARATAEQQVAARQTEQAIRRALAALPERQAAALVMASYHGLSLAEIGESLDISDKAVKSLLNRARESLKRTLAPLLEEPA